MPQDGGEATRITTFSDGDVRFPAISADGKTIVFERDFRLWKLDVATRKPEAVALSINSEPQDTLTEYRTVNSEVEDYDPAPTGRNIVAAVRGELYLVPVGEDGELLQLTKGSARDRNVEFSPDGKLIALVSDKESGREEIYVVAADGSGDRGAKAHLGAWIRARGRHPREQIGGRKSRSARCDRTVWP